MITYQFINYHQSPGCARGMTVVERKSPPLAGTRSETRSAADPPPHPWAQSPSGGQIEARPTTIPFDLCETGTNERTKSWNEENGRVEREDTMGRSEVSTQTLAIKKDDTKQIDTRGEAHRSFSS